jgi:hypothetical protein
LIYVSMKENNTEQRDTDSSSAVTKVSSASVVANELREWTVMIVSRALDKKLDDGWAQFVERDPGFPKAIVRIFVRYRIAVWPGR